MKKNIKLFASILSLTLVLSVLAGCDFAVINRAVETLPLADNALQERENAHADESGKPVPVETDPTDECGNAREDFYESQQDLYIEDETTGCIFEWDTDWGDCSLGYENTHPFRRYEAIFGIDLSSYDPELYTVEEGYILSDTDGHFFFLSDDEDSYSESGCNNYFLIGEHAIEKLADMKNGDRVILLRETALTDGHISEGVILLCVKLADGDIGNIHSSVLQALSGFGHEVELDPKTLQSDKAIATHLNLNTTDLPVGLLTHIPSKQLNGLGQKTPYGILVDAPNVLYRDGENGECGVYEEAVQYTVSPWPSRTGGSFHVTRIYSESQYTTVFNCSYNSSSEHIYQSFEANGYTVFEDATAFTAWRGGITVTFEKGRSVTVEVDLELPKGGVLDGTKTVEDVFGCSLADIDMSEYMIDEGHILFTKNSTKFLLHDDGTVSQINLTEGDAEKVFRFKKTGDRIAVLRRHALTGQSEDKTPSVWVKSLTSLWGQSQQSLPHMTHAIIALTELGYRFDAIQTVPFDHIKDYFPRSYAAELPEEYTIVLGVILFTENREGAVLYTHRGCAANLIMNADPVLFEELENGDFVAVICTNDVSEITRAVDAEVSAYAKLFDGDYSYFPAFFVKDFIEKGVRFDSEVYDAYHLADPDVEIETEPREPDILYEIAPEDFETAETLNRHMDFETCHILADISLATLDDIADRDADGRYSYGEWHSMQIDRPNGGYDSYSFTYTVYVSATAKGYFVTSIRGDRDLDSVYGCTYNSTLAEIQKAFEWRGYTVTQEDDTITARLGGVSVAFEKGTSITVSVDTKR